MVVDEVMARCDYGVGCCGKVVIVVDCVDFAVVVAVVIVAVVMMMMMMMIVVHVNDFLPTLIAIDDDDDDDVVVVDRCLVDWTIHPQQLSTLHHWIE